MLRKRTPIKHIQFFGHSDLKEVVEIARQDLEVASYSDIVFIPSNNDVPCSASNELKDRFTHNIARPVMKHLIKDLVYKKMIKKINPQYWLGSIVDITISDNQIIQSETGATVVVPLTGGVLVGPPDRVIELDLLLPTQTWVMPPYNRSIVQPIGEINGTESLLVATVSTAKLPKY